MYVVKQQKLKYRTEYALLDFATIEIGSTIIFNILIRKEDDYVVIIKPGTIITEKLYEMLQKQDALYISKKDQEKQSLGCESLHHYIDYHKKNYEKILKYLYSVNSELFTNYLNSEDDIFDLKCAEIIVNSIITMTKENQNNLNNFFPHLSTEHTLPNHSLHVSIYAIHIGNLLRLNNIELNHLGTAGLFHDLGLKKIDTSIKDKKRALTLDELESVKKHSRYSANIAKYNSVSNPYIIDAILHHHENHDGTGYPDNLHGDEIKSFASILSISDVFDALTSDRPYRESMSTFNALTLMLKDSKMINKFNEQYIKLFLKSLLLNK